LNPSLCQNQLIEAYKQQKHFITINSGLNTGKTIGSLAILAHHIIKQTDGFIFSGDDQRNLFGCLLCSSKDSSEKNLLLAQ